MKNVNDKTLCVAVILFIIALFIVRVSAQQFEYKGLYTVEGVLVNYCDSCFLELPPDFLKSEVVLSVKTDSEKEFLKAVKTSSRAIGWELSTTKDGYLRAQPLENVGMMVYISCMDKQPHNVPKYLYSASVKADRMQCAERDSLFNQQIQKMKRDSVRADSLARVADSVARAKLDFESYQLRYYAFSQSFVNSLGVEWGSFLASGNLRGKLDVFDDWRIIASQMNDTTFTARMVEFSVDSSLSLDWGSEEQTIKQTFVNNGVTTQDYEWRKYGLLIQVKRDGKRVKVDYVFRDKDNSVSVLQGSVIGNEGDTLKLVGTYNVSREVETGVPFLSSIPILGNIFKTTQSVVDNRAFELYLLPKNKAVKDDRQDERPVQTATNDSTATDGGGESLVSR